MLRYIANRILISIPLLFAISIVVFLMGRLLPGDPVALFMASGDVTNPELVARIRAQYNLDDPLIVQYLKWIVSALQGDLGVSIRSQQPVFELLLWGLSNTSRIAIAAVFLVVLVGWPLGVLAAVIHMRSHRPFLDRTMALAPIVMLGIPSFSVAVLLIYFFAIRLAWLPTGGISNVRNTEVDLLDLLHHMILPTIALAWASVGSNWRLARNTVIEVLHEDYIRTAHAKGLRRSSVFYVHALRNSLIPLVTSAGLLFGSLLSGSFILESLFSWPGIGSLMVNSVLFRDYPVVQGGALMLATIYLMVNLFVDVAYAAIDPRIRYD
jgi:peptide/nickel transport system permease protein